MAYFQQQPLSQEPPGLGGVNSPQLHIKGVVWCQELQREESKTLYLLICCILVYLRRLLAHSVLQLLLRTLVRNGSRGFASSWPGHGLGKCRLLVWTAKLDRHSDSTCFSLVGQVDTLRFVAPEKPGQLESWQGHQHGRAERLAVGKACPSPHKS